MAKKENEDNQQNPTLESSLAVLEKLFVVSKASEIEPLKKTFLDLVDFGQNYNSILNQFGECCDITLAVKKRIESIKSLQEKIEKDISKINNFIKIKENAEKIEKFCEISEFEDASKLLNEILHKNNCYEFETTEQEIFKKLKDREIELQQRLSEESQDLLLKQNYDKLTDLSKIVARLNMQSTGLAIYSLSRSKLFAKKLDKSIDFEFNNLSEKDSLIEIARKLFDITIEELTEEEKKCRNVFQKNFMALLVNKFVVVAMDKFLKYFDIYLIRIDGNKIKTRNTENFIELDKILNETAIFCQEIAYFKKSAVDFTQKNIFLNDLISETEIWEPKLDSFNFKKLFEGPMIPSTFENKALEVMEFYTLLEKKYLRQSVLKAFNDKNGNFDFSEEAIEDFCYIMKKVVERAFSTFNAVGICDIFNYLREFSVSVVLDNYKNKWDSVLTTREPNEIIADLKQGNLEFLRKINILLQFSEKFLFLSPLSKKKIEKDFIFEIKHKEMLLAVTENVFDIKRQFEYVEKTALNYFGESIFIFAQKSIFEFLRTDFEIESEKDWDESESAVNLILIEFTPFFDSLKLNLNEKGFLKIVKKIESLTALTIEKEIFSKKFSIWGGIQFDSEIVFIVSFFAEYCNQSTRKKFNRLLQIASILQSENPKNLDFSKSVWKLSEKEINAVLKLRSDLN